MIVSPLAEPQTFAKFCDRHGVVVIARERSKHSRLPRWYASAAGVEIRADGLLASTFGEGATPEEAFGSYAARLAGHRLVLAPGREVVCPNEWTPA